MTPLVDKHFPLEMAPLKIILTIDFSPWSTHGGGAQRSTHYLATALSKRGHDVSVVFTKPPWETVNTPDNLPYKIHWATFYDYASRRRAPLRPLNAFSVARVVRGLISREVHTVVHCNGEEGGMIHTLRPSFKFGLISTPRHPHYPEALLTKKAPSFWQLAWLVATQGKYLMQGRAVRHADLCVPPSKFAARLVSRAFNINSNRFKVVYNGIPTEFLTSNRDALKARNGPIVFFGRFELTKGVDTLIEAVSMLGENIPPVFFIGRGDFQKQMEAQIRSLGLEGKISILPWMAQGALADVLRSARMVVLPSRVENFSLAVLSAMAVGVPVIGTRVGGTPEIIEHNRNGVLVSPGSSKALAVEMERLLSAPEYACDLGQAGQKYVQKNFTWDLAAEKFERLYRSLPVLT